MDFSCNDPRCQCRSVDLLARTMVVQSGERGRIPCAYGWFRQNVPSARTTVAIGEDDFQIGSTFPVAAEGEKKKVLTVPSTLVGSMTVDRPNRFGRVYVRPVDWITQM
jgi:hypothetical protein